MSRTSANRRGAGRLTQLNLFSSPLGEFVKEGLLLCLRQDPPGVRDSALLEGVCRDVRDHCDRHPGDTAADESASDIESLTDSLELINAVLDHFDDWRSRRRDAVSPPSPLTRPEVNTLFEIRAVLRMRMIGLFNADPR